jgi:multidrug efflux pump subunit AcrA (membrane-fusion protein)
VRYLVAVLGLVLVLGGLAAVKYKQIASLISFGQQMQKAGPPPETVGTTVARSEVWDGTLNAVGSIAPVRGVALSNDAPGVVQQIDPLRVRRRRPPGPGAAAARQQRGARAARLDRLAA